MNETLNDKITLYVERVGEHKATDMALYVLRVFPDITTKLNIEDSYVFFSIIRWHLLVLEFLYSDSDEVTNRFNEVYDNIKRNTSEG